MSLGARSGSYRSATLSPPPGLLANHAVNARIAFDAPKRRFERYDLVAREELTDSGRRIQRFGEADFSCVGQRLDAGGDVHGLTEIIEIVVKGYGDRGATMGPDLQDDAGIAMRGIVGLDLSQDVQRRRNRICRAREGGHHR